MFDKHHMGKIILCFTFNTPGFDLVNLCELIENYGISYFCLSFTSVLLLSFVRSFLSSSSSTFIHSFRPVFIHSFNRSKSVRPVRQSVGQWFIGSSETTFVLITNFSLNMCG